MKLTTSGKSHNKNWYGLTFNTKVPMSWTVTVETLSWEVWKITITTSNGTTTSMVLKQTGDKPLAVVEKRLFHKNRWNLFTEDVCVEDYVGE